MCVKLWNKFIESIYEKIIKIDLRMIKFYDYTYVTFPHIQNKGLPINKFDEEVNILKNLNIKRCLEVGSSEGIFSEKLAGICQHLTCIESSDVAVRHAKKRLRGSNNINILQDNFRFHKFNEKFDLITLNEILYYIGNKTIYSLFKEKYYWLTGRILPIKYTQIAKKIDSLLNDGGYIFISTGYPKVSFSGNKQVRGYQGKDINPDPFIDILTKKYGYKIIKKHIRTRFRRECIEEKTEEKNKIIATNKRVIQTPIWRYMLILLKKEK